eukprot:gene7684-9191_t
MHITVIGAGAWGTAMAMAACRHPGQHVVRLHARDASQAAAMQAQRQNLRYLPGVELPENLSVLTGPVEALLSGQPQELWVLATPMSGLRSNLQRLQQVQAPLAWLCKGFEAGTGLMPHEVQAQTAPGLQAGALSGPSFALEVARQQPTALVAASAHAAFDGRQIRHGRDLYRGRLGFAWLGLSVGKLCFRHFRLKEHDIDSAQRLGVGLLVTLMALAVFNDVARLL